MMRQALRAIAAALVLSVAVGPAPGVAAAADVQPDVVITSWVVKILGSRGVVEFHGNDVSNGARTVITALFDPSAVKGIPNLTQPDNVQALVAAMQAKDWSSAHGGYDKFSPDLEARFKAAGININWVYQRLYTPMNPGDVLAPWVPTTPQPVYLNGKGPVAQPPKPQRASGAWAVHLTDVPSVVRPGQAITVLAWASDGKKYWPWPLWFVQAPDGVKGTALARTFYERVKRWPGKDGSATMTFVIPKSAKPGTYMEIGVFLDGHPDVYAVARVLVVKG